MSSRKEKLALALELAKQRLNQTGTGIERVATSANEEPRSKSKMNRKMGYLTNVKEAKKILEKIYNKKDTKDTNNKS